MKKKMQFLWRLMLTLMAFVIGASSGVMMADASALPDAGKRAVQHPKGTEVWLRKHSAGKTAIRISIWQTLINAL